MYCGERYLEIFFTPLVSTSTSHAIGFRYEKGAMGFENRDTLISYLGWTPARLSAMMDNMEKTRCQWIMTDAHNKVLLAPYQEGWGSFTYSIIPEDQLPDSNTLSTHGFGRQMVLIYSSAL